VEIGQAPLVSFLAVIVGMPNKLSKGDSSPFVETIMPHYSHCKDLNQYIKLLIKNKIVLFQKGKRHHFIVINDVHKFPIPGTPSDRRAYLNFKTDIQRAIKCKI
jgi:hypothetical protein